MTLTPDASRPEDNDKFRKANDASMDPSVPNGYGYDNVGNNLPPKPDASPYASAYGTPEQPVPGYEQPGGVAQNQGMYHNPAGQVPQKDMWSDAQRPENMSTILGASSIGVLVFSFILGPLALASPILAIFGILQANKATRFGVNATLGKVLSWIGLGLNILGIIFLILFMGFFLTMFGAAATSGNY